VEEERRGRRVERSGRWRRVVQNMLVEVWEGNFNKRTM